MGQQFKQIADGSVGLEPSTGGDGGFVPVSFAYNASSVDATMFVCDRPYVVKGIRWRVEAAGTDAGAVTAIVRKVPSGTAINAGTALHSSTANLKGAAATNQTLTVSTTASDLLLAAGDAIAVDFTGVMTAATGCVTVTLNPAG